MSRYQFSPALLLRLLDNRRDGLLEIDGAARAYVKTVEAFQKVISGHARSEPQPHFSLPLPSDPLIRDLFMWLASQARCRPDDLLVRRGMFSSESISFVPGTGEYELVMDDLYLRLHD
jgi:hypothetical protein